MANKIASWQQKVLFLVVAYSISFLIPSRGPQHLDLVNRDEETATPLVAILKATSVPAPQEYDSISNKQVTEVMVNDATSTPLSTASSESATLQRNDSNLASTSASKNHTTAEAQRAWLISLHQQSNESEAESLFTQEQAVKLSRIFPVWNRSSIPYGWCHEKEEVNSGILFVKVPKCASSTGMGVTMRIADTLGKRLFSNESSCFTRYRHGSASTGDRKYLGRNASRSVLWTLLRHPRERVMSAYFFYLASRKKQNATEEAILDFIKTPKFKHFFLDYIRLDALDSRSAEIAHTMQHYDFLGISERMDETLVVLALLLQVPLADVIVMNSKTSGGYDDGRSRAGCVQLKRKWTTPNIDAYLQHDFLENNWDHLLYKTINVSLDRTIDALGRDRVEAGVKEFHALITKNDDACRDRAIFPCPIVRPNQTLLSQQDCYFSDAGCGHLCTDTALHEDAIQQWRALHQVT